MGNLCPTTLNNNQSSQNTTSAQQIINHTPQNNAIIHGNNSIIVNNNANNIQPLNNGNIIKEGVQNKSEAESKPINIVNNSPKNGINNMEQQQKLIPQNNGLVQLKNNVIENEKNILINETNNLKVQLNELQRQLNNKDALILKGNKDIEELKKKNFEYENEKKIITNEKNVLMNETKNLKLQFSELQRQLNNKDALYMQANKDIEELKKITLEYETMKIYYQKKENEYKTYLDNAIIQTKAQYKNIMLKQREEMEKYKKENEQMKTQNQQLKKENSLLKLNKEPILVGLNNIGATCYMNATLQCLSNTTNLTEYFLKKFNYEQNNKKRLMSNEYYNVVNNLWDRNNNNKSFSPESFKEKLSQENPLFKGIQANDSKDLINFLLERFHLELNEPKNVQNNNMMNNYVIAQNDQLNEDKMLKIFINEFEIKYNSIISNLFYGMFETKSQCQKCKNIKYNFQVYSFLEFPLEQVNKFCFNQGKRQNYNSNKNPDVDLYECFEYNSNLELMSGDNQMYCNICNSTQDALYGTQIYSAPIYLIINLNRGRGAVYECNVNFPEKLNIINFITFKNGNTVFELYAVICHLGPSSMSGHFVAYCKKKKDDHNKWYLFNDAFVSECKNQEEYRNGMPYILFYKAI